MPRKALRCLSVSASDEAGALLLTLSSEYIADHPGGKPLLPPGMRELLHEDLNKSFDF
jgi:ribosome biogenesis SPOUT family RNA methylase Rps3